MRVQGFGGYMFDVKREDVDKNGTVNYVRVWMTTIADRIAGEIKSVRDYPLAAEPGAGPVVFVTLKGAEGDISAGRELRAKLEPIFREELAKESREYTYRLAAYNKGDDLLYMCTVIFP